MFHQTQLLYFAKPLIKGIEFCFLHAKLVIKSGKESFDCRNACREKKNPDVISPPAQERGVCVRNGEGTLRQDLTM